MDLINEKDFNEIFARIAYSEIKRTGFKQDLIKEGGQHKICIVAARHGYTDMLKVIKSKNLSYLIIFDERVSSAAAFNGHLLTLQWLQENGCICDADTCKSAAEGDQKEVLKWLKKSGCPWDYRITEIAAQQCNVDILKWAIENGCEWDPAIWSTLLNAIRSKIKADTKNEKYNTASLKSNSFGIFFWADNLKLYDEKFDGIFKCLRFFRFCTYKMKVRSIKKRIKVKYQKVEWEWEDVTSTVDAIGFCNTPFYWSIEYFDKTYNDNSEVFDDANYKEIIGENDDETLEKCEDEISKLEDIHLQTKGGDREDESNDTKDITDDFKEGVANLKGEIADYLNGSTIELTAYVDKWYLEQDNRYKKMFVLRLQKICSGSKSYSVAKPLTNIVVEAKLDGGMRILWTKVDPIPEDYHIKNVGPDDQKTSREIDEDYLKPKYFIWYVSKHDDVNHNLALIEKSLNKQGITNIRDFSIYLIRKQVLIDPSANLIMKVYTKDTGELNEDISKNEQCKFGLKLTREEKSITRKLNGSLMVFGRSGTGKTICLTDKMRTDRQMNSTITQLFVARSSSLCNLVKSYQQNHDTAYDSYSSKFTFFTFKNFMEEMYKKVKEHLKEGGADVKVFNVDKRVNSSIFKHEIWKEIAPKDCTLAYNVVWTQIHSCLKGSIEVVVKKKEDANGNVDYVPKFEHLTLEEYMDEDVFPYQRTKVTPPQRAEAYKIFENYRLYLQDKDLWDDSDKALYILKNSFLQQVLRREHVIKFNFSPESEGAFYYDRVYIDEVQDFTQAEILLFFLSAGMYSTLLMVGDTAQAVEEAVSFRFEEIRGLVYKVCNDKIPKPIKLNVNFRSHKGILDLAANVIEKMKRAFGQSDGFSVDIGILEGPKATFFPDFDSDSAVHKDKKGSVDLFEKSKEMIKTLIKNKPNAFFLTPESNVVRLKEMTDNAYQVLSIVDSKGLEFMEVVIVDFFSSIAVSDCEHWKRLFTLKPDEPLGDFFHPHIEFELKKLYVAITRARNRLVFIETGLFDVNGNGRAFELVQAVWKSWSGVATKNKAAASLVGKVSTEFTNEVIQQSDYEIFASALNFIQTALDLYDDNKEIEANVNFEIARQMLSSCKNKSYLSKLEIHLESFSIKGGDKEKSLKCLRECLDYGMYDNVCDVLKKIAGVNDEDNEGGSSGDDAPSDEYDSDTQQEKVMKDGIIKKLITHLNGIRRRRRIEASVQVDKAAESETLERLKKLKKSISKISRRKIREKAERKRLKAIEESKKIKEFQSMGKLSLGPKSTSRSNLMNNRLPDDVLQQKKDEIKLKAQEKAAAEEKAEMARLEEERIKREAEERIKREAEERIKREAEERIKREAEERIKREAEDKRKREAEEKRKREAEERSKREAEDKRKREATRREEERREATRREEERREAARREEEESRRRRLADQARRAEAKSRTRATNNDGSKESVYLPGLRDIDSDSSHSYNSDSDSDSD